MKRFLTLTVVLLATLTMSAQNVVTSDATVSEKYPAWRIAAQGGYAFSLGILDKSQDAVLLDHSKKLRHGYTYGADATWYFMKSLGAGIKYNSRSAHNSEHVTVTYEDGTQESGLMEENMNYWFLGPMFSYRVMSKNMRSSFIMNFACGYVGYDDDFVLIDPYKVKGWTLGYMYELGYDIGITDKISVGAAVSLVSANLFEYKTNINGAWETVTLENEDMLSASYVNVSIGLRFNL